MGEDEETNEGGEVANALVNLKMKVEELDPGKFDFEPGWATRAMGMLPFVVPWPMMGLGIFGAFLQTFVFIMLTMVYIGGATAAEEH